MGFGYWGKVLFVNLSTRQVEVLEPPEDVCRQYLGGYGLGAHYLYGLMQAGTDPLGPDNIIGFLPGLLTGSGAPFSGRFMVVGRSPLTGAWGDANCGGDFGPALRGAGWDGLFVTGQADAPVYLFVDGDRVEIRDAEGLWGLDTKATEEATRGLTTSDTRVACIGPAGENLSILAAIVNDGGRAAARCGLGAVMGAKRLKAVAARGKARPPLASPEAFKEALAPYRQLFRRRPSRLSTVIPSILVRLLPFVRRLHGRLSAGPAQLVIDSFRRYGTAAGTATLIELGDAPVRNWTGIGFRDFPLEWSEGLSDEAVIRHNVRPYACHSCPVACGAIYRLPDGTIGHKPEYETIGAFGPLILNKKLDDVSAGGELCNLLGLDSISTGVAIAFAMECRERGWLPEDLAEELTLSWGDGASALELVRRMADREPGLGAWLADGALRAALRLGPEAQEAAMHAGGQELTMHRGIYEPGLALGYVVDPAPGRHSSTLSGITGLPAYQPYYVLQGIRPASRYDYQGKGPTLAVVMAVLRAFDSLGLCQFALQMGNPPFLDWLNAATGWGFDEAEFFRTGKRIQLLRHSFNAREGLPAAFDLPAREVGNPPQAVGPVANVTLDMNVMTSGYFAALGIDPTSGLPFPDIARRMGIEHVLPTGA